MEGHVLWQERTLGRHAGTAGPHEGIVAFGAFFGGQPRMYGKYYPRQAPLRLHPNLAIPPCGPSTRRRHYQPTEPAMKKQRTTDTDDNTYEGTRRHPNCSLKIIVEMMGNHSGRVCRPVCL
jgi:hypothetical protein